jgi:RHS repeat-associated protein
VVTGVGLALMIDATLGAAQQVPPIGGGGIAPMCSGCPTGIQVTPVPGSATAGANLSGLTAKYVVSNGFAYDVEVVNAVCSRTGSVSSCGSVTPTTVWLPSGAHDTVRVTYATGSAGSGTVTLTVYHDAGSGSPKAGTQTITVSAVTAPGMALRNRPDHLERSLCLTTSAGEATVQCGDLMVAHGLPAYRSRGRERVFGLLYNAATAAPKPAIALAATQGAWLPDTVLVELKVGLLGGAGEVVIDTFRYTGWSSHTRQLVLAYDAVQKGHATGIYSYTVSARNKSNSAGLSAATVITGLLTVVNRSASPWGRGWAAAGVEWIQFFGPGDQKLLWVGGDGSARIYSATPNGRWAAPLGAYQDTIAWEGGAFRRRLKQGVEVHYDGTGNQVRVLSARGDTTQYTWSGGLLASVQVPSGAAPGTYTLTWASGAFERIKDPAGRELVATRVLSQVTRLTDPDNRFVEFGYDASGRMTSRKNRLGYTTLFWHTTGLRLDSVAVPYGPTGSTHAVTRFAPADHKGLRLTGAAGAAVDTSLVFTTIFGPRDMDDDVNFSLDPWGAPTKRVFAGFVQSTWYWIRGDLQRPALVTRILAPNGRVDSLTWNARGNLTEHRIITADRPVQRTQWTYGTTGPSRDLPVQVRDPMDRLTYTWYDSLGRPDSTRDSRGLKVRYGYHTTRMLGAVWLDSVPVWREQDSTIQVLTVVDSLLYEPQRGNLVRWRRANGASTSYATDTAGRVIRTWDARSLPTRYSYDALNRATEVAQGVVPEAHPGAIDPLAGCNNVYTYCSLWPVAPDTTAPGGEPTFFKTRFVHGAIGIDTVVDPRSVRRTYSIDARALSIGERDEYNLAETAVRDAAGLVTSATTRAGHTLTFAYDQLGRPTSRIMPAWANQHPGDAQTVPGDTVATFYDLVGNVTRTENRDAVIQRGFHQDGLLRWRKVAIKGTSLADSLAFTYDAAGAVTRIVFNGQDTVRYTYHASGDLDSVVTRLKENSTMVQRVFRFQWDRLGRRTQVSYPDHGYGMTVSLAYDALGGLRRLASTNSYSNLSFSNRHRFQLRNVHVGPTGLVYRQQASCSVQPFDTYGVLCGASTEKLTDNHYTRRGMLGLQQMNDDKTDSLRYDASGNLILHRRWDAGAGTYENRRFWVDSAAVLGPGNRLVRDSSSFNSSIRFTTHAYTATGARRYERPADSVASNATRFRWYYYDAAGRMTGTRYLTWVPGDVPSAHVGPQDCRYDGEGNMTKPCENGAPRLLYNGVNVTATSNGWRFIHGPGLDDPLLAIRRDANNAPLALLYYVMDGMGRQYSAAGPDGRLLPDWIPGTGIPAYTDWTYSGGTARAQGFSAERFTGQSAATANLSFFRNRAYDGRTGRWLQEDPIGIAGGVNLYQFNRNNPVSLVDPFGLKVCFAGTASEVQALADSARKAASVTFDLDAANCATNVQAAGSSYTVLGNRFREMAEDPYHVHTVFIGAPDSRSQMLGPFFEFTYYNIDPKQLRYIRLKKNGMCESAARGGGVFSVPAIIAHELLGHGYVRGVATPGTDPGVEAENLYHADNNEPLRCP